MDVLKRKRRNLLISRVVYRALQSIPVLLFVFVGLVILAMKTPYDFVGLTDTKYAEGFSRTQFQHIGTGDSQKKVLDLLGEPFARYKHWTTRRWIWPDTGVVVTFDDRHVIAVDDPRANPARKVDVGMTHSEVWDILGLTDKNEGVTWDVESWSYSTSPGNTNYWQVGVNIGAETGKVVDTYDEFYFD